MRNNMRDRNKICQTAEMNINYPPVETSHEKWQVVYISILQRNICRINSLWVESK